MKVWRGKEASHVPPAVPCLYRLYGTRLYGTYDGGSYDGSPDEGTVDRG